MAREMGLTPDDHHAHRSGHEKAIAELARFGLGPAPVPKFGEYRGSLPHGWSRRTNTQLEALMEEVNAVLGWTTEVERAAVAARDAAENDLALAEANLSKTLGALSVAAKREAILAAVQLIPQRHETQYARSVAILWTGVRSRQEQDWSALSRAVTLRGQGVPNR